MHAPPAIQRLSAWPGYLLFSLATLLWVAAALPAGPLAGAGRADDASTPLALQAWLLVPALLLLIVAPVGMTLTAQRQGQLMLLAATDAFLATYAGLVLLLRRVPEAEPVPEGAVAWVLGGGLLLLGALSVAECRRIARSQPLPPLLGLGGLRLALCLLVLLTPSWALLWPGPEPAGLLSAYLYLLLSAAGARLARTGPGLAFASSLLQLGLAAHVLATLQHAIHGPEPEAATLGLSGLLTLALAWTVFAMAGLQVLVRVPRRRASGVPASAAGSQA